jgi:molybdenum cofactor cytidylyltransferase
MLGGNSLKCKKGIYGIVLASGQSTRMGKPKLLLLWKGISLLEHVLNQTVVVPFKEVKVVLPKHNECIKKIVAQYAYTPIHNEEPHIGLGHSLAIAVQSLPLSSEAAIIFLGDQPTLSAGEIRRLWFTFKRIRSKLECCPKIIIQIKYLDGRVGHPILFSYHFFEELRSLCGDTGGKDIIRKNSRYVFLCYSNNEYPNDIDTPYEYHQLLKVEGEDY